MKPKIDETKFGSITIEGDVYYHDIIINKSKSVEPRNSEISKKIFGTSHKVSLAEIQALYVEGTERIIFGNGQSGKLVVTQEALEFLEKNNCKVEIKKTPDAIDVWNGAKGEVIGLFHVTC